MTIEQKRRLGEQAVREMERQLLCEYSNLESDRRPHVLGGEDAIADVYCEKNGRLLYTVDVGVEDNIEAETNRYTVNIHASTHVSELTHVLPGGDIHSNPVYDYYTINNEPTAYKFIRSR